MTRDPALRHLITCTQPTVKRLARKLRDGLALNVAVKQAKGRA